MKLIFLIYGSNKPNIEVIGLLSNQNTLFVKKIFKEPFLTLWPWVWECVSESRIWIGAALKNWLFHDSSEKGGESGDFSVCLCPFFQLLDAQTQDGHRAWLKLAFLFEQNWHLHFDIKVCFNYKTDRRENGRIDWRTDIYTRTPTFAQKSNFSMGNPQGL